MKVVLFCGGLGLRLRDYAENIPKPMATIGYRPILWHVMKYYAHYGHKDFILCLGHRADTIKNYRIISSITTNTSPTISFSLQAARTSTSSTATSTTGESLSRIPALPPMSVNG